MPIRTVSLLLAILFLFEVPLWAGLGSDKAMYMGGTIAGLREKTEGKLSVADSRVALFEHKGGKLVIPYDRIDSLEYGQKAGRRVGMAVVISPFFLFSKKRRHYLTIGFKDENDKQQAAVMELGKSVIKPTLEAFESRSGKKIEYQDEEARKSAQSK